MGKDNFCVYGDELAQYIINEFKLYNLDLGFEYDSNMFISRDKYDRPIGHAVETHIYAHELKDIKPSDKDVLIKFIEKVTTEFVFKHPHIADGYTSPELHYVRCKIHDKPSSYSDWIYLDVKNVVAQFEVSVGAEFIKDK